jgi:HSP20 family protein
MKNTTQNKYECKIYPGEFIPTLDFKNLKYRIKSSKSIRFKKPNANIIDTDNTIIVEISIPGVNKEDFHIEVNENILSVFVFKTEQREPENKQFKLHEFECIRYERHLPLPKNADPSFVSANYNQGILKLLISKSNIKSNNKCNKIAVY